MNDFDQVIDFEIENRLRRMARSSDAAVPSRLFRYVEEVAGERVVPVGPASVRLERLNGPSILPRGFRKAFIGLAAALVIAVAGMALLVAVHPQTAASSPSPAATWPWTGLAWQEITSTSFPSTSSPMGSGAGSMSVVDWHGQLLANPNDELWRSSDGVQWQEELEVHSLGTMLATKTWLLGLTMPCFFADCLTTPGDASYSTDGKTWQKSDLTTGTIASVGANDAMAIVLRSVPGLHDWTYTSVPWVSRNGATWNQATSVPAEMASAVYSQVVATRSGFVVSGIVEDPSGSELISGSDALGPYSVVGFYRNWYSADGLVWKPYEMSLPADGEMSLRPWIVRAALGDEMSPWHSADGFSWVHDSSTTPALADAGFATTDGNEVLVQGSGPSFAVTRGDGAWQTLRNTGDFDGLPQDGRSWITPSGVLYDGGGRVFWGRPVSGADLAPTLAPGPTLDNVTPAPLPTVPPLPSFSTAPARNWNSIGAPKLLAGGPDGATSVTAWSGGYLAIRNGAAGAGFTFWTSTDGKSWEEHPTPIMEIGSSSLAPDTGSAAAIGKSVAVEVTASGSDTRMTAMFDGSTWWWSLGNSFSQPSTPISGVGAQIAGDGRGMVSIGPDSAITYQPDETSPSYNVPLNGMPGTPLAAALSGDRWVLVGASEVGSPATVPASWASSDAATWTPATMASETGQRFVSIVAGRGGFVASAQRVDGTGPTTLWTSTDGLSWTPLDGRGPAYNSTVTGDGTHLIACETGTSLICWSSLDSQIWTRLAFTGDMTPMTKAGSNLRVFPMGDGVLFVTDSSSWYAAAAKP